MKNAKVGRTEMDDDGVMFLPRWEEWAKVQLKKKK